MIYKVVIQLIMKMDNYSDNGGKYIEVGFYSKYAIRTILRQSISILGNISNDSYCVCVNSFFYVITF